MELPQTVGNYELVELLGKGGMAAVYRGRHRQLGNQVAIKILDAACQEKAELRRRFIDEARIQANLRHQGILQIRDVIDEAGLVASVMEYLEGQSLDEWLPRGEGIPLTEFMTLVLPLCDALSYAHSLGIVHRDLKPGNVFLCEDGGRVIPKLMDFGIAKLTDPNLQSEKTSVGSVLGTPHYMAPEQLEDASTIDSRADIWSFGVLMYRLLAGTVPFVADSLGSLMSRIMLTPHQPLQTLRNDLPPRLVALVDRCLKKPRQLRWQSMAEVHAELDALGLEPGPLALPKRDPLVAMHNVREGLMKTTGRSMAKAAPSAADEAVRQPEPEPEPRQQEAADPPPAPPEPEKKKMAPALKVLLLLLAVFLLCLPLLYMFGADRSVQPPPEPPQPAPVATTPEPAPVPLEPLPGLMLGRLPAGTPETLAPEWAALSSIFETGAVAARTAPEFRQRLKLLEQTGAGKARKDLVDRLGRALPDERLRQETLEAAAAQLKQQGALFWVEMRAEFLCRKPGLEANGDLAGIGRLWAELAKARGLSEEAANTLAGRFSSSPLLQAEAVVRGLACLDDAVLDPGGSK